ncbi:NiFe hydrogenase assembly chaperone HyaE [Shewanella sp. NFH-SH190041]|uniref:Kae1-like domain-containing protein n=1 Tax=Shewanella sp. NFH-SH190041 TaxID=2950245 RepID=UPI0021C46D7A|nr:hypothetical protein [Shewanella sp. NFH-SH190041]BDM64085.1 NiFe hydrogenase assembly chaperone HyaE [Shewanella sp. NFH-SH190041]
MKLVRFELQCAREVPFYAQLCNRYLQHPTLDITIAYQQGSYIIEAEGEQTALEQLAEQIAADFLMSVWLTGSQIRPVETRLGTQTPISLSSAQWQDYCQHCFTAFGDNQSPEFGNLLHTCPVCQGEKPWQQVEANNRAALTAFANKLLEGETLTLADGTALQLNQPFAHRDGLADLLVCNPNTLNQFFALDTDQVLALSALEKPFIRARCKTSDNFSDTRLTDAGYRLCFSYQRQLIVLAEILRQRGVNFVFIRPGAPRTELTWMPGSHHDAGWAEITAHNALTLTPAPEPLHDDATLAHWQANWRKQQLSLTPLDTHTGEIHNSDELAKSALLGALLERQIAAGNTAKQPLNVAKTAGLYFSAAHDGKLVYTDNDTNVQTFLTLPTLPQHGAHILAALQQGKQAAVTARFAEKFPATLARLARYDFAAEPQSRASLSALSACAAILLDLGQLEAADTTTDARPQDTVSSLALALQFTGQQHQGKNAPRIDYPLVTLAEDQGLSIDWLRTLGSVMAFRLADPDSAPHIAFGVHDSMADYFANWIEHLDQKWGIDRVALSGDEMANSLLAQCLALRIGKNFELLINRRLPLDGANCAAGALYLKQRRRR